jgi:hypothetical protein
MPTNGGNKVLSLFGKRTNPGEQSYGCSLLVTEPRAWLSHCNRLLLDPVSSHLTQSTPHHTLFNICCNIILSCMPLGAK